MNFWKRLFRSTDQDNPLTKAVPGTAGNSDSSDPSANNSVPRKAILEKAHTGISYLNESDIAPLVAYGLVRRTEQPGRGKSYAMTHDGVRYIDGMLCTKRFCSEHPNSWDDLTSVSRGRMISLRSSNLTALSCIYLDQYSDIIVAFAKKEKRENCIIASLQTLAGFFAHAVRHYSEDRDIDKAKHIYQQYRELLSKIPQDDETKFIGMLLDSWHDNIEIVIKYLSGDRQETISI